ncbi:MAG: oligosaccharide flippase family protein [Anaerolineales bacterium]|nr:oligosaccharide flippase family protein [Anaerolineales bacterium]
MPLLENVGWTVASRVGTQGVAVLSNILLARYLGSDGFGEYAFISSVLLIGNAFSTFGMDMILIRSFASEENSFNLADGLLLQLLLSMLYIAGVFLTGLFTPVAPSLKIYIFALLPLAFFTIFNIELRARQKMKTFSLLQFVSSLMQLLAVLILWLLRADINSFTVFMLIAYIASALYAFIFCPSPITQWRFSLLKSFSLLKVSARMAVIGTLRLVYEKIAVAIMPALAGLSMTGIFSVSSRLTDAGKLGHLSAFTAIYPEMARDPGFSRQMKGLRLMLGAAFLISVFIFTFAEKIIYFLFGAEFMSSVLPLQIMIWVIVPYVLVTYTSLGLVALGNEKSVLSCLLTALIILLTSLAAFTPVFGLSGAAAAILLAEIIHAALLLYQWRVHVVSKLP